MSKNNIEAIELEGVVVDSHPNTRFSVKLENGNIVEAIVAGKMRMNWIKVITGDKVRVLVTPYDIKRGRIVYRY